MTCGKVGKKCADLPVGTCCFLVHPHSTILQFLFPVDGRTDMANNYIVTMRGLAE
jgi:hypothetical protein